MSKIKKQHFVPQFYLKNFSSGRDKIYVFDRLQQKSFSAPISKIACEQYFYDIEDDTEQSVEKYLCDLEGFHSTTFHDFINRVTSERRIPPDLKEGMASFMALQFVRTSFMRKIINQTPSAGREKFRSILPVSDYNSRLKEEQACMMLGFKYYSNSFLNNAWFVREALPDMPLYTTDHPVTFIHSFSNQWGKMGIGVASQGIEISLPLSPTLNLSLLERRYANTFPNLNEYENNILPLDNQQIKDLYFHQISFSSRQIFCSKNSFQEAQMILNDYPRLKNKDFLPIRSKVN